MTSAERAREECCSFCGNGDALFNCRRDLRIARNNVAGAEKRGVETPYVAMNREMVEALIVAVAALERCEDAYRSWVWEHDVAREAMAEKERG